MSTAWAASRVAMSPVAVGAGCFDAMDERLSAILDSVPLFGRCSQTRGGGVAAMSRDALITTAVAVLFASAIVGAMWWRGIPVSMAAFSAMETSLVESAAPSINPSRLSPEPVKSPQLPPIPPVPATRDEDPPSATKADKPPEKKPTKKPALPTKDVPALDDDFLSDMPLPPIEGMKTPPPVEPNQPATVPPPAADLPLPDAPDLAEKKPTLPPPAAAPPPAGNSAVKADLSMPVDSPSLPGVAENRLPPAPAAAVVRSQPIVDNPAASIASQDEPSPPTVAAEVTGIREIDEPSAHADVGRVADPTPATTSRERNPVIPAPPGGARVKRPNPAPTTSVEPTGSVLARAKPVTKESPAEPAMVKAEPIAQAKPPEASTGGENAVATPIDEGEEYRPIHRGGERYIPLGSVTAEDRPAEEFYSADYLPLSGSRLARGETTVVSQVRKAGLETPRVVAYDARMYVTLEGDTFDKIADTMYRSPAYGAALARYNRSASGPTDFLSPGSRVRIPPIGILDGSGANGAEASREAFQRVPPPSALAEPAPKVSATNPFDAALIGGSSSAPTGPGEYRTQEVETLWSVAKKTLGDGRRWREIYNLNRDRLTNEINVPVGLVLKIPKTGTP